MKIYVTIIEFNDGYDYSNRNEYIGINYNEAKKAGYYESLNKQGYISAYVETWEDGKMITTYDITSNTLNELDAE